MNKIEGFKLGLKTMVGVTTLWAASNISDGRVLKVIQAEEVKPQTSQDLVLEQDVCTQQIAWMKKKDGTLYESKNGCIPKDGTMPHPEGILFLPGIQTGQIK